MKKRLDLLMVERALAPSREKAKAYIMSGDVYVDGQKEDKAGTMFQETVKIEVRGNTLPYVSRGGLKLEKAMNHFEVTLDGKVCMDVGASTGGFTDCMLQNGAVKVYSIDVGYGQLDWKLRNDPRVVCMEKTNIRYVVPEDLQEPADFSSIDVSFISLTKVLLPVRNLLTENGEIVCLIKPQFEAGREKVGKKGVVRDPAVHLEVIEKVIAYAQSIALEPRHLSFSPIKGPEGNIEYLLHLKKQPEGTITGSSPEVEPEREKAKAYIMSGDVYVDGQKEDKAGTMFQETVKIEVRGNTLPYVSRGGLKLEKAMNHFEVTLDGKVCMDVGASTGGFTDCMLQNGAVKVYSIDVGYGQLDWKLRNDPRVVCMEKTNIRYVVPEDLQEPADFSSIDVSFISLTKVLLPVRNLLTENGEIVCLIKPQFEAGREKVGKKGVVRDPAVHLEVIEKVIAYAQSIALEPRHLSFSPIKGPEGNIEYLLHLKKQPEGTITGSSPEVEPENIVRQAHDQLD